MHTLDHLLLPLRNHIRIRIDHRSHNSHSHHHFLLLPVHTSFNLHCIQCLLPH